MRVYVDLVAGLNFLVDLLLLLGTNRLMGFPAEGKRCAAAAALGGVYGGACMLPGFRFLGNLLWRTVSLGLMAVIAFGLNPGGAKRGGVFLLLTMALGGVAASLNQSNAPALVLAAGGIWLLCRTAFCGSGGQEYVPVRLTYGGKTVDLTALRDTGNTLRDPISGEPVLVVSAQAAEVLTGLTEEQLRAPLETLAKGAVPGLRLIPYRAVGQGGSFLLALKLKKVRVGSRVGSCVVAFDPGGIRKGDMYQALTGGAI